MVPNVQDILGLLDTAAPFRLSESWDNSGLQTGQLTHPVQRVFSSLDPTMESLDRASAWQAQVLLTHHPLFFRPISRIQKDQFPGSVVFASVKRSISIISCHTNADAAKGGLNDLLAEQLDLRDVQVLAEQAPGSGAGLGRVGSLPEPCHLETFVQKVKETIGHPQPRIVGRRDTRIERVAVVCGSGASLLSRARDQGAHVLLTGDVGHHAALEAQTLGLTLVDGGHFYVEKLAFGLFVQKLARMALELGWEVAFRTYEKEEDPIRSLV